MLKRRLLLVICFVIMCLSVTATEAGLAVVVDSSQTKLTVTSYTDETDLQGTITAVDSSSSDLYVAYQDLGTGVNLDGVEIDGYTMQFVLDISGSGQNYAASGTFKIQDVDATTTWDIMGAFTSSSITLTYVGAPGNLSPYLDITGELSTMTGQDSILIGSDPWVFEGESHLGGAGDADSNTDTITVTSALSYTVGGVIAVHYPVAGYNIGVGDTLEDLFDAVTLNDAIGNGSIHAQITPVPGAVILGILGLGVAGWKLRKYA